MISQCFKKCHMVLIYCMFIRLAIIQSKKKLFYEISQEWDVHIQIYIVLRSLDLITCAFTNPEVLETAIFSEWLIKSIVCKFSELIQILILGGIIVHVLLPIAFKHVLISNCVSVIPVLYIKLNTN